MNSDVKHSRVQMEPNVLQQLVAEVKETIATDVNMSDASKAPSFKAINFWSIQRNGRYASYGTKRKKNATLSITHVSF